MDRLYESGEKMKYEEAIKVLQTYGHNCRCCAKEGLEASKIAIEVLNKQIPKKLEPKKDTSGEYYVCPVCGVYQETSEGNPPYCINCGQAIDFGKE